MRVTHLIAHLTGRFELIKDVWLCFLGHSFMYLSVFHYVLNLWLYHFSLRFSFASERNIEYCSQKAPELPTPFL